MTRAASDSDAPNTSSRDAQYALVGGLYAASVLTPVAVLGVSTWISDAALLYVGFLAVWVAFTTLFGWLVSRTEGVAVRIGRRDAAWVLAAVPFVVFIGAFVGLAVGTPMPPVAVPLAMITMITGFLFGFPLVVMSQNRHADFAVRDATEFARWEARWPLRWRRLAVGSMVVGIASAVVAVVAQLGLGADWATPFYLLAFLWTPLAQATTPRTVRVTDAGLVVERPLIRRFRPWEAFEAVSLSDDALVVHPTAWWRPSLRFDRDDIEDVDAAVTALERGLAPTSGR
jgi:hypothetical protein